MTHDVTGRLRLLRNDGASEERIRNSYYADAVGTFHDLIRNESAVSELQLRRYAQLAIKATCIFEEEWEVMAMAPLEEALDDALSLDYTEGWPA